MATTEMNVPKLHYIAPLPVAMPAAPAADQSLKRWIGQIAFTLYIFALAGAFQPNSDSLDTESITSQVFWLIAYLVSFCGLWLKRERFKELVKNSRVVMYLIAYLVVSSLWSDDRAVSMKRAFELVGTCASAYFVVCSYSYKTFLARLAVALAAVGLVSAFFIAFMPETGIMQEEYRGAWRGLFVHKNLLAQSMALGIAVVVMYMSQLKALSGKWLLSAAVIGGFGILLFGSNSATSFGICLMLLGFLYVLRLSFYPETARTAKIIWWVVSFVLVAACAEWQSVFALLGRDSTLTGRTDIWPPVIEQIQSRPLLGFGYDSFWLPDGSGSSHFPVPLNWVPSHAHNGFLELALDGGLAAVALFLAAFVRATNKGWKFAKRYKRISYAFPLIIDIYLLLANLTEANIAKYGEINWALFLIGNLYASIFLFGSGDEAPVAAEDAMRRAVPG